MTTNFKPLLVALQSVRAAFRPTDRVAAHLNPEGRLTIQVVREGAGAYAITFDGEDDFALDPVALIAEFRAAAEAHFNG